MGFRKIFTNALFILAILALAVQGLTLFGFKPKEKNIGLQLWSVKDHMQKDPKGTIAKVGQMGYQFVEAAGFNDGKFYGMTPLEFKNLCETSGLKFLGSHTGQNLPDAANWEKTMAWWDTAIDAHAEAGVKWIVQPWMSDEGYNSLEGLKDYMKYFNAVGEKCKAKGIQFGYHNHDKEFTTVFDGKPVYDWMLELADPEFVMFELDLYWIDHGGKKAMDYFDKYPGKFKLWHIKDKAELGSGHMDFTKIFDSKKQSGLEYGIVEVEEYNFDPLVSVEKSLEYLKSTNY